jgi:uncharacterized membrane protein
MIHKHQQNSGAWFHPKTLLDKSYEIGIIVKGIDGTLELIGAVLLLVVPAHTIEHLAWALTHTELEQEPHNFIAEHVMHFGQHLASGSTTFAVLFLLTHGAVKVGLVTALLRQKLWAYPWALVALSLFLVYQVYVLAYKPTFGIWFLTVLDAIIIWLVWREWGQVMHGKHPAAKAAS